MTDILQAMRDLVQEDVGRRGLAQDPVSNLITACSGDFAGACRSIAETPRPAVGVVTGFFIPQSQPPAAETDGPLGALFLARVLVPLGIKVVLAAEGFCLRALEAGLESAGMKNQVTIVVLPIRAEESPADFWRFFSQKTGPLTHLIALERPGPSHTLESLQAQLGSQGALGQTYLDFLDQVPPEHQDRYHTMRGRDITTLMSPAHFLFEEARRHGPRITTIGIGDGGNEIGMGKISWEIIQRNIPSGGLVACRVPTDFLIVCGVSNWGAYALGAGVATVRGQKIDRGLFDPAREGRLLRTMVQGGPLVDGVTGKPTVTVDGLPFDRYVEKLRRLGEIC